MAQDPTKKKLYITLDNFLRKSQDPLVRFEQDDIIPENKQDLAQHLVDITNDAKANQEYKNTDPSIIESGIRNVDGTPATILTDSGNKSGTFFSETVLPSNESAANKFNANSNTGMFEIDGENLGFNVVKGKQQKKNAKSLTFEELFAQENLTNGNIVSNTVAKRQEQTTRFNANKQYLPNDGTATEKTAGTKDFIIQNSLGIHSPFPPGFLGRADAQGSEGYTITVDQLQNLGVQIMLKASGEYYMPKDEGTGESFKSLGTSLAPGLARIGQRVNYQDFSANTIMDKVNPNYAKPLSPSLIDTNAPKKKSFGAPYNPVLPFDGFVSDAAAIVAAGAMAASISAVVLALASMFGTSKVQSFIRRRSNSINNADSAYDFHERMLGHNEMGSVLPKQNDSGPGALIGGITGNQENLLGLIATKNDYKECVKKGLNVFFNPANQDSRNIILTSPNYANTILRNLTRDLVDVGLNVANLAGNDNVKGSLEVNTYSNQDSRNSAGTVESSLRMITQLKNNRLIKFMNVLAMLGDAVIIGDKTYTYIDKANNELMNDYADGGESVPSNINLQNFHKKSRLSAKVKGAGGLATANNTIPSMYLRTKEIEIGSMVFYGKHNAVSELTNQNYFHSPDTSTGKLSQPLVKDLETKLASTYMPFYFHDLRTNEIIAFHAFLDNISDGFDADYTETEAYGRLGKVYKWKNTNRQISLGFWAVSTSPQDFDEMWLKINKLVMLTLPQYSEGRKLTGNFDNKEISFAQPFSQVPTSSPLIRLRLGDIFTTNYSKFDLARLFGIGNASLYNIKDDPAVGNGNQDALQVGDKYARIEALYKDLDKGVFSADASYVLQQDFFTYGQVNGKTVYRPIPTVPNQDSSTSNPIVVKPAGTIVRSINASETTPDGAIKCDMGGTAYIQLNGMPASLLQPSQQTLNNIININTNGSTTEATNTAVETIKKFFNQNENPIFQGFESTSGEGMAGFIRNIKFDWDQSTIWGTDESRKAPTMMKISLEFLPIFDLNPGLDSNGFMIGAPYKIGNIMKQLKDSE